ncbi:hypothetical protein MKX01_024334 [Papaver californicum]|nr:hypothetical protein MKX01_024334 [Papaver californicum]
MEACLSRCSAGSFFRTRGVKTMNPNTQTLTRSSSMEIHIARGAVGKRAYDALLLDAGGALLQLAKPVEETYADIGRKHGLNVNATEIKYGFRRAFTAPCLRSFVMRVMGGHFGDLLFLKQLVLTIMTTLKKYTSILRRVMHGICPQELMKHCAF